MQPDRHFPIFVDVREVGPREGFQSQRATVPTATKIRIIDDLMKAGFKKIDVCAFVNPKVMPHMADAEEVITGIEKRPDVTFYALVLNQRGLQRAIAIRDKTGYPHALNFTIAPTASPLRAMGIEQPLSEHFAELKEMVRRAKDAGFRVATFVSCAFGCSMEGRVDEATVIRYAEEWRETGTDEIVLSDSTGQASPLQIQNLFTQVKERFPGFPVTAHFHDTRGAGLANLLTLLQLGLDPLTVDSAFGGLGGDVPFVPQAAGNIATEDLICMLDGMGIRTGIDVDKVIECSRAVEEIYGNVCPARALRVGPVRWRERP